MTELSGIVTRDIPKLSDDVLSDENALLLAVECRRGILSGETLHHHQIEALCCWIIKQYERAHNAGNQGPA